MSRINDIEKKIREADLAYYNSGAAIMEDAAYDLLKDELRRLDPDNELLKTVGAPATNMLAKLNHSIPMGSQEKATNRAEFDAWVATLPQGPLVASLKLDGGSVSLEYDNGNLIRAVTRGDGLVGEDITANALQFHNTPKNRVSINGSPFTGFVRCEIILTSDLWKRADPDLVTNPRNKGNGIARRKDGEQADLLTVYAFRAHWSDGSTIAPTESEMLILLEKAGFQISPWFTGSADEVWQYYLKVGASRSSLPFWIDGVVVKLNDIAQQIALGERDQRPKGQIAIKFEAEGKPTVLRSVLLTVGHTGAIIPTGQFDPVQIGGTTVSSALLCNWDVITDLDLAVGDTVLLIKAGDIIPRVLSVLERPANRIPIAKPEVCPICGGPVGHKQSISGERSVALYCLNDECPAKRLGKIDRYVRSLNILGIGDEVLETLVNTLEVVRTPADLYRLRIEDLENIEFSESKVRLGAKRAEKILQEIAATRSLTLPEFLGSLGIDGLGKRRVALIQNAVPGKLDSLEQWIRGDLKAIASDAGVPNVGARLSDAVVAKRDLIAEFLANGVTIKASEPKPVVSEGAKSFCFTGALSVPRAELAALAAAKGHIVKDDVSKGLSYLVMADPNSTSSKATKARKIGTLCIGEEEFRKIVG